MMASLSTKLCQTKGLNVLRTWDNLREEVKYYFADLIRKGGTPSPFSDKNFSGEGVTDLGSTPSPSILSYPREFVQYWKNRHPYCYKMGTKPVLPSVKAVCDKWFPDTSKWLCHLMLLLYRPMFLCSNFLLDNLPLRLTFRVCRSNVGPMLDRIETRYTLLIIVFEAKRALSAVHQVYLFSNGGHKWLTSTVQFSHWNTC